VHRKEKNENLKSNIRYLIKSRGETQMSLCIASGLTRTTIYNILEGKVSNVQHSTVRKISNFFGVSYDEIERIDFEEKEMLDRSLSIEGNMNPAAVPVIKEGQLISCLDFNRTEIIHDTTVKQRRHFHFDDFAGCYHHNNDRPSIVFKTEQFVPGIISLAFTVH